MTGKRFEFGDSVNLVIDNVESNSYGSYNITYLIKVLNELYEEVMALRRENTKFKLTVREIIEDMQKYVDDNQLVYINQSYVDWIKKQVIILIANSISTLYTGISVTF